MTLEFENSSAHEPHARTRTARRVVAGVGAAMMIAAAGGVGFGIGRNVDRNDQLDSSAATESATPPATQAPGSTEAPAPTAAPADEASTPDGAVVAEGAPSTDAPGETLPLSSDAADEAVASVPSDGGAIASSGGGGWAIFGTDEMDLLFERTTDSGISIRAQLGALWPDDAIGDVGAGEWRPPGWCYQSGEARIALSGAGIIDVGSVGWYTEPYQGRSVSWLTLGRADGNPHRVIFAQVPEGTALVTAMFGDGAVDEVVPQNGVAVLVVDGAPETIAHDADSEYGGWVEEIPDFTVTFGGTASGTGDDIVTDDEVGTWYDPVFAASCSPPPPSLPDAGELPADPAAAEADIVAAMSQLYGQTDDGAGPTDLLDDATGVEEAREQVRAGGFETEASNAEAIVEELVFTTPTEAWFRYRVETGGVGLNERYGIAVQIDGVWLITRATLCQDLAMAGGSCGGDVDTIRPPGAEFRLEDGVID